MGRKKGYPAIREKTVLRLILEILLALAAAFLIELCLNRQALRSGYGSIDVSWDSSYQDGNPVYTYVPEEPLYVKNLILQGTFSDHLSYTVNATIINDFGVEESLEISDKVNPEFDCAYTGIRKTVSRLEIIFEDTEGLTLTGISLSNEFSIHPYRLFFSALICFLAFLILFEKKRLVKKPELLFAVFSLGFGSLIIGVIGPCSITWDEEAHFSAVCTTQPDSDAGYTLAEETNFSRSKISVNTLEELDLLKRYMNRRNETDAKDDYDSGLSLKSLIAYFPMILFYRLGCLFHFSFSARCALGKFGNLLFCTVIGFLAIRLAKRKKFLIGVILSMPTVLFQCSTYTYDGMITSCMTLGVVLCMNGSEECRPEKNAQIGRALVVLLLFGLACITKPVYAPAFLLILFLFSNRKTQISSHEKKRLLTAAFLAVLACFAVFLVVSFLLPLVINLLNGNTAYGGDPRGGDTSMTAQLLSILKHPAAFLKMLIHEILTMDHFRNYQSTAADQISVLNLLFLNLYVLGRVKDAWSLILMPLLLLLFLAEPEEEPSFPANIQKIRLVNAAIFALSVILIWIAMYLIFTPVGSSEISGVQTRYFLPLFLPAAYAVWNRRISVGISRVRYFQIVWGTCLLLSGVCFCQTLIIGRVL